MTEDWPWERRRDGELTTVYLGRVLEEIGGLGDMPRRAREGHFDDYFAPPEVADGMEMIRLYKELYERQMPRRFSEARRVKVLAVMESIKEGEFDATREESDRWAASADGQATFRLLLERPESKP